MNECTNGNLAKCEAWFERMCGKQKGYRSLLGGPLCYYILQRSLRVTSIRETIFTVAGRAMYRTLSIKAECLRKAMWVDAVNWEEDRWKSD